MKVSLPQASAQRSVRSAVLQEQRKKYQYDYAFLPKLAVAKKVVKEDDFTTAYIHERVAASAPAAMNKPFTTARNTFDLLNEIEDYRDFFFQVPAPGLIPRWQTDEHFGEQRLSGANPLVLQQLDRDDPRREVLKQLDYKVWRRAIKKNEVYVADYTGTDPAYRGPAFVQGGKSLAGAPKYLAKPLAFFHVGENGKLMPIAIQLDASLDAVEYKFKKSRIYTPDEVNPVDWLFAKIAVQSADSLHHEMSTHLARCHFTMEPIAVATKRTLADEHPLALLLNVHMRFIIANDAVAHYTLVADGGNVDNLMPGTLRESLGLLTEAYEKWDINDFAFPKDLETRNVDSSDTLPHYPYRDDGRLLWDATEKFVEAYLGAFYPNSRAVRDDEELQAWAAECGDQKAGARVKGMPCQFDNLKQLTEIVTSIVFLCGPGHSAVNFAQYENMAFAPNMPLALYQNIYLLSEQEEPITMPQLMACLPDFQQTLAQVDIVFNLTAYRYDQYGNYDRTFQDWFGKGFNEVFAGNSEVLEAMSKFQAELADAEKTITARNADRASPYEFMLPSKVLNSISI